MNSKRKSLSQIVAGLCAIVLAGLFATSLSARADDNDGWLMAEGNEAFAIAD